MTSVVGGIDCYKSGGGLKSSATEVHQSREEGETSTVLEIVGDCMADIRNGNGGGGDGWRFSVKIQPNLNRSKKSVVQEIWWLKIWRSISSNDNRMWWQ